MSLTTRVAATAALLMCLSAGASAAILADVANGNDDQSIAAESDNSAPRASTSALGMSVTSGVMLSSAAQASGPISTEIALPVSMTAVSHARGTVTLPAGLTLIQVKSRAPLPSYMQRASASQR